MNPMMDTADDLGAARRNHSASRWVEACERYAVADRVAPLSVEDRERWAEAAQVGGRISEAVEQLGRCFEEHSSAGAIHEATRAAYWLWSAHAFARAEFALGAGWVERAREAAGGEEYGWLLIPQAYRHLARGDWQTAEATLRRASELGLSCGDVDLVTIATTMRGRATLKLGFLERGVALLDEAIVRIVTGSTSVRTTCAMYCAAIGSCYEAREIGRAPDLIVTDYRLGGGVSGTQVIDRLRRELGSVIPAIVITGDSSREAMREVEAAGHTLLHKPIDADMLEQHIAQAMSGREQGAV